jgi:hypothetical protein
MVKKKINWRQDVAQQRQSAPRPEVQIFSPRPKEEAGFIPAFSFDSDHGLPAS